jgi:hypothetical protein
MVPPEIDFGAFQALSEAGIIVSLHPAHGEAHLMRKK